MSKIKVYVRVRPALPGEFDTPGCFNCTELEDVSGNWIKIKKEGEPMRYFARVWGPNSTQEEVFRTIGVNTVNDVFEGYYGCVFVYGQTGTGKTFSLGCLTPGFEGIQPQCIRFIFEKIAKEAHKYDVTVKQHYVQLYRDSVQDLLDITKDNLKIAMDAQTGATIEKVTIRDVTSYEESIKVIVDGDSNRAVANTKMNSASSRSHACLITEIWRKDKATGNTTFGRLYLIDLAGSERVSKSGVTDDAFKEAVAINKSLTTLGNCIAGLVNGDKVVSFRDSPLTRILQHSLSGHGRTSIIITIRPDSPNMQETLCTIKFGERAQKVEAQMTPAGYRDNVLEARDKIMEVEKSCAEYKGTAQAYVKWAKEIKESIVEKEQEVKDKEASSKDELEALKQEHEKMKKELEQQWLRDQDDINSKTKAELDRLRQANASVIAEIDEKVKEAENEARERLRPVAKAATKDLEQAQRDQKRMLQEIEELKKAAESVDFKAKAQEQTLEIEKKIAEQKMRLRGCRKSRFEELALPQLQVKLKETYMVRGHMRDKMDEWKDLTSTWEAKPMKKFKFDAPNTVETIDEMIAKVAHQLNRPPTPPAKEVKKDVDSDDSDDDKEKDSDDESVESSMPPSEEPETEEDEDNDDPPPREDEFDEEGNKLVPRVQDGQLHQALQRDVELGKLLTDIVDYLDTGTIVFTVEFPQDKTDATNTQPGFMRSKVTRRGMALADNRTSVLLCELKSDKKTLDKSRPIQTFRIAEIASVVLGQYSEAFLRSVDGSPLVPQGTVMPVNSDRCSSQSLRVFFQRSVSLLDTKKKSILDIVFFQDADFEAWIVTFHRLTVRDPLWGGPLDTTSCPRFEELDEMEQKLCSASHIPPSVILDTKNMLLRGDSRQLFYTLFDMRSITHLDLLHAQKVFSYCIDTKLIERHNVYHIRYRDHIRELAAAEKAKKEARELCLDMLDRLRFYRKANEKQLTDFLRIAQGKEKETLGRIEKELGPRPTEDQMKEQFELDGLESVEVLARVMSKLEEGKGSASPAPESSHVDPNAAAPAEFPTKPS